MHAFIELSTQIALITQQLQRRPLAYDHHRPHLSWEITQNPPQEQITSLEEAMSKLGKSQAEFANSQVQFMEEIRATFQI